MDVKQLSLIFGVLVSASSLLALAWLLWRRRRPTPPHGDTGNPHEGDTESIAKDALFADRAAPFGGTELLPSDGVEEAIVAHEHEPERPVEPPT